jgi:hypothetical protein
LPEPIEFATASNDWKLETHWHPGAAHRAAGAMSGCIADRWKVFAESEKNCPLEVEKNSQGIEKNSEGNREK